MVSLKQKRLRYFPNDTSAYLGLMMWFQNVHRDLSKSNRTQLANLSDQEIKQNR